MTIVQCVVPTGVRVVFVNIEFFWLGVVDLERAAAGVDVTSVEGLPSSGGGIDAVKLNHRLDSVLLEYHDALHWSVRLADGVQNVHCNRIDWIDDGEQQDMVRSGCHLALPPGLVCDVDVVVVVPTVQRNRLDHLLAGAEALVVGPVLAATATSAAGTVRPVERHDHLGLAAGAAAAGAVRGVLQLLLLVADAAAATADGFDRENLGAV